ncbi:hypothetical protein UMM65_02215 [Aureibaculum sp. 2210JD6-5]|nr:hypothetical protein [Aureibaculum sp. 2210JD6-5]MDY7394040.1 hypothetical protein [Aureibaculum sp. 2210JD6-5]
MLYNKEIKQPTNTITLSLKNLKQGIYFSRITSISDNTVHYKKLIKE